MGNAVICMIAALWSRNSGSSSTYGHRSRTLKFPTRRYLRSSNSSGGDGGFRDSLSSPVRRGHQSDLVELERLGIQSNVFFYRVDSKFFPKASAFDGLGDLVRFDPTKLEDSRNIIVGLISCQVLVDPQCSRGVSGGTEGSHVHKAVVIELPAKGLEVAGVEVFGQDPLGEGIRGKEHQQSTAPFDDSGMSFSYQHVVKSPNELVEPVVVPAAAAAIVVASIFGGVSTSSIPNNIAVAIVLRRRVWIRCYGDGFQSHRTFRSGQRLYRERHSDRCMIECRPHPQMVAILWRRRDPSPDVNSCGFHRCGFHRCCCCCCCWRRHQDIDGRMDSWHRRR